MAETSKGKKMVYVHGHTREDGTKVPPYYRSTPDTAKGPQPKRGKSGR
jgi:hypothetical protein